MKAAFYHVRMAVVNRFGDKEEDISTVQFTAISAFIFLRFFCPAIINPRFFGIVGSYIYPFNFPFLKNSLST